MKEAKDKAEELIEKFKNEIGDNCQHSSYCVKKSCQTENGVYCFVDSQTVKNSALICVDEILTAVTTIADRKYDFYQQVKQEILNRQ